MNAFLRLLEGDQTLIADGATGTNLQHAGLAPGAAAGIAAGCPI